MAAPRAASAQWGEPTQGQKRRQTQRVDRRFSAGTVAQAPWPQAWRLTISSSLAFGTAPTIWSMGLPPLKRISVGIEHPDDLKQDLEQAIAAAGSASG